MWTVSFENLIHSDSIVQHNLLKQFHHISPTNFAILFSSENIKEKKAFFKKKQLFSQACFSYPGNQVLLRKKAIRTLFRA